MAQTSLIIGDTNWAVKEDSLLGYNVIQNNYLPIPIDCVRATTATRVNEQGLIEIVPRNILQYSQDFSNAYWFGEPGNTITSNTTTAPDGTLTADTFTATAGDSMNVHNFGVFTLTDGTFTYSIYLKNNGSNLIESYLFKPGVGFAARGEINFSAGTFTASIGTGSIENIGNDWYRVSLTNTYTAGSYTTGTITTSTTGTRSVFAWGAQLEQGSVATEYFPTTNRLDIPRIDYSTGTASLLVEPQRTNVLTYSNDFTNAVWTKSNSTIVANSIISPDGTQNASKIVENSANDQHRIFQSYGGTNNVFSFYAKAGERSWVCVLGSINYTFFNVSNGTIGTIEPGTVPTITSVGNGWYRCTLYNYHPSFALIGIANGNNIPSYQGNGTSGLYVWGAQVEQASYATSYIPTIASSVTRNADVLGRTGVSGLIGQTEGTVFVELYNQLIDSTIIFLNKNNTNSVLITSNALGFSGRVFANGIQYSTFSNNYIIKNEKIKIAFKYSPSGLKLFVNGSLNATNTNTISFTATIDGIFLNDGSIINLNQTIYNNGVQLYKTALTDAECIALTTI